MLAANASNASSQAMILSNVPMLFAVDAMLKFISDGSAPT
jgi:hypothetical protein